MAIGMYVASIPVYQRQLGAISKILEKGSAWAAARKVDEAVLGATRLIPDMLPLTRQVQIACRFAEESAARLAGVEVPKLADDETSFADLQTRLDTVLAFMDSLDVALFTDAATREIITQAGTPKEKRFTGQSYVLNYGLPHFFFHTTTAYAILRHNGVEIGKKDYIGTY